MGEENIEKQAGNLFLLQSKLGLNNINDKYKECKDEKNQKKKQDVSLVGTTESLSEQSLAAAIVK
jgi:hypothetical protein